MSGTTARWTEAVPGTLIASVGNLASGTGWANSGATLLTNTARRLYMDIELALAAAVTAGTGSPRVDVYLVPAPNGADPAEPPGTTAGATPSSYFVGSIVALPGAGFARGVLRGVILPPGAYLVSVNNQLGAALGAGTHVLTGYAYGEEAV